MKIKTMLILTIALILMSASIRYLYQKNQELKTEIKQKQSNINQLESDNYSLTFKKGELEKYIKEGNTEFKRKIDSITSDYDIRIKDLKKVSLTKITTIVDTVFVPVETVINLSDNLYHSTFVMDTACIKISGKVISRDSTPQLIFSKIGYENEAMHFAYKEPKKWWQFFKRRKLLLKTVSECGEVSIKELIEE